MCNVFHVILSSMQALLPNNLQHATLKSWEQGLGTRLFATTTNSSFVVTVDVELEFEFDSGDES